MKKDKQKIKRVIFGILIILWMVVVFCFSSEQGIKSTGTSENVIKAGLSQVESYKKMEEPKQQELVENLQYPIRKLAHFTIYTVGGLIIFNFINTFNMCYKKKISISILIGFLYAAIDETHQLFTLGRTAQIKDVLIDTAGVCVGCIIMYLIIKFIGNKKK